MYDRMPEGTQLSLELPRWVRVAIGDAVVVFGRMEQEIIEILWILRDADPKLKRKLSHPPARENLISLVECVETSAGGEQFDAIRESFKEMTDERNLMVHGAWTMANDRPWVVWHKFVEDDESVVGEFFERWRFERFMRRGDVLLNTLRQFHNMLEERTGKKTSAVPRS